MPGEYESLMSELDQLGEVLAKAQPVQVDEDEAIKQAADGRDTPGAGDKDDAGKDDGDDDAGGMFKSFQVTLEDGTVQEAYDATAMMKSLHGTISRQADTIAGLESRIAQQDGLLRKVPALLKSMGDRLAEQGEMLRALREAPAGRRSVTEAPQARAATPAAMPRGEVLAKCLAAVAAGRLSPTDAAVAEARLNDGIALPQHIQSAIAAA